ncbi:2-isopropylmalate synthase [Clostridium ganghwense]|uniref:2-isopropylmalate synthase n=1 Tax=Clostridium ganghwense TaxID=312089 RepID=A0ABT4CSH5_9CLOT|nr:2-isopropylmalate synthase [Clostridium ganghwense]MCY6372025.1 2-isopropylmalate synthase [Clostridium ganghwense]
MSKKIQIFDTTLRDGEQTPGVSLNVQEKLEIAKQLEMLEVDVIEAGFPIASNGDFEAVKAIAKEIKKPIINALARANKKDIDRAWEALKYAERPRIHTFIATSDIHMKYKLNMEPEEVLKRAVEMVSYAKTLCDDIEFSPEDGSRTCPEFLYKVLEAVIDAGATVVNIPDTVGYTTPVEFGEFIRGIKENVPNIDKAIISVHCHNDLGLAVANSLAAIENGAEQIECAVNGLGERAGNASLEEIVMALKTRKDYFDCYTNVVSEKIHRVSSMVSHLTGVSIQANKAIVGVNAFAHESGIHQHGVLMKKETYEIMTPESIGLKENNMVLGKHSGRHAFQERLKELGYNLDNDRINEAFKIFKDLADKKKEISDKDIEALVNQDVVPIVEKYNLKSFQVITGNNMVSTATVKVKNKDEVIQEAACGDGPINAVFNAIERTIGVNVKLEDYALKAITSGKDALGEVTVKIDRDGNKFVGRGISMDVIEASVKAYMNAINKMASEIN